MDTEGKIWIALDTDKAKALRIAEELGSSPAVYGFKVNRLMDAEIYRPKGEPRLLEELAQYKKKLWADMKIIDIPETVKGRVEAHAKSNLVGFLTVMARGGIPMMIAAIEAGKSEISTTEIIAVTELTSLDEEEIHLASGHPAKASVIFLAQQAVLAKITYLVCSGLEMTVIRKRPELQSLELFVPAVRPIWYQEKTADQKDQKRTTTPIEVLKLGPSKIIIGRPIVNDADPKTALERTIAEIEAA